MRKRILILLALCGVVAIGAEMGLRDPAFMAMLPKPAAPVAPFYTEGFEGSSYENAGWGEVGTVINENYTNVTLVGTNSLFMDAAAGFFYCTNSWSGGAQTNVYGYVQMMLTNTPNSIRVNLVRPGVDDEFIFEVTTDAGLNKCRVHAGGSASPGAFGTFSVLLGTTNHVWFEYHKGTGADATAYAWISETPIKPTTYDCFKTGGSSANAPTGVSFQATTSDQVIFDKLILSTAPIGSNP